MSTEINPENEQFIESAVASGDFASRDDVLNEALRVLRQRRQTATANGQPPELSKQQWVDEFRAWVASQDDIQSVADDSRESIYAGRGE